MFKLLETFFVVGLILLLFWSGWNIAKHYILPQNRPENSESIDQLIATLKRRIEEAELDSANGIVDAEEKLENYKKQLARAQELKGKTSNL